MKRDLKIWLVILGIVAAGMGITMLTDAYISNKRMQLGAAAHTSYQEEGAVLAGAAAEADAGDYRARLAEYGNRFLELDVQIGRMRGQETDNTIQSVKSAAGTELRIWERELDAVYTLLLRELDEEAGNELRADQQKWIMERDSAAQQASRKNSGSMESLEYTAAMAASARDRAYQLVERYGRNAD